MVQLRHAKPEEATIAIELLSQARSFLQAEGNFQWDETYPSLPLIEQDIANQKGYVVTNGNEILGYLCADFDGEPAYEKIKGSWLADQPYVVVHRMGFGDAARGKGIVGQVFQLVQELALERGIHSIRVDTDEANKRMQHILPKNGFTYCGLIWFVNGDKLAYEKLF